MQSKKNNLRRITALYLLLFVVIIISIAFAFSNSTGEFFRTGKNDAVRMHAETSGKMQDIEIYYDVLAATSNMDFDIPVFASQDGSLKVNARPSMLDIEVASTGHGRMKGVVTGYLLSFAWLLCYIVIFVIIFIILTSLRRSTKREGTFERSNITLTRAIGILLIAASLLSSLTAYIDSHAVAGYFAGSGYYVSTSFRFNFMEIITGCLVLVIAEIFSISYSISEENKLTI